ncbi:MAG: hypothetical protein AB1631_12800 [Acidobacteriota bacterium]
MSSLLNDVAESRSSQPDGITPSLKTDDLLPRAIFYSLMALSFALLAGGVAGKLLWKRAPETFDITMSVALGIGVTGVALALAIAGYKLFEYWRRGNSLMLAKAFAGRDQRGRRVSRRLSVRLASLDNLEDVLGNQTEESLLALLARSDNPKIGDAILNRLGVATTADALMAHPECSTFTKIDFALGADIHARRAAEKLLPRFLRQRELRALIESNHPEARIAAIRRVIGSRDLLVKACLRDPSSDVREVAWQRIERPSPAEIDRLLSSPHEDTRLRIVRAGLLPRDRLIDVFCKDASESIRREVCQRITSPTAEEVLLLLRSPHADVRACAVETGLRRSTLIEICRDDAAMSVRHSARERLQPLTETEALLLLQSRYVDARCFAVESGLIADKKLLKLCRTDKAQAVRKEALEQIKRRVSIPIWQRDAWKAVEEHLAATRKKLDKLLGDAGAWKKKLPRLIELMSVEELKPVFSRYSSDDVKRIVIRHLGERRDKRAIEILKPLLTSASLQQEAVEAFLKIEGNSDLPTIIRDLGLTTTFQVTDENRLMDYLGSHFKASASEEIADTLSLIDRKSKRIDVGTVEVEDTEYDAYGSYYTYTRTDNHYIEASYFPPDVVSKTINLLKLLDERKQSAVARLLSEKNPSLGSLIQLALDNQDWKADLYEPVLRAASEMTVDRFTRHADERIIRQIV